MLAQLNASQRIHESETDGAEAELAVHIESESANSGTDQGKSESTPSRDASGTIQDVPASASATNAGSGARNPWSKRLVGPRWSR